MRTSEDLCLLCASRKANKKNSHIVPRFMTKSILGNQTAKRAYRLNTMNRTGHTYLHKIAIKKTIYCVNFAKPTLQFWRHTWQLNYITGYGM